MADTVTSQLAPVPEEGYPAPVPHRGIAHVQFNANQITGYSILQAFDIKAGYLPILIENIVLSISEAFSASTTITIGTVGADVDYFMDSTAFGPTATGTKNMNEDAQPGSSGYIFTSADTIDLHIGGATPSVGTVDVYLFYALLGGI